MFFFLCLLGVLNVNAFHLKNSVRIQRKGLTSMQSMQNSLSGRVLIVQNKGGGHGTVGYQLCKELLKQNSELQVTILQDQCNYKKPPFSSYDELKQAGAEILDAKLIGETAEVMPEGLTSQKFDYIIDNWSKNTVNSSFVIDIAQNCDAKQLLFVSSAGMYKDEGNSPHVETDPVKINGPREVELNVISSGIPYTFMRPQYIYGPKISKRYLDYFIGRAYRKLQIPLPLHGEQLVCLTHIADVAGLLAAAVGNPAAYNEIFNCGTDRYVSYKGLCELFHDAMGNLEGDRNYMYYDPKDFSFKGSGAMVFPFRRDTFITTPSKAKTLLGWTPKHKIEDHIKEEIDDYEAVGGMKEKWGMDELRCDLEILASKDINFMFTYPFLDDQRINTESKPYGFESGSEFAEILNQKEK